MNFCGYCGSKLTQDGKCIACLEKIKQGSPKKKCSKAWIIGIAAGVVALTCAIILGVSLLSGKDVWDHDIPKFVAEDYDQTGTCGEDAQWGFKEKNGELVIIGTGEMEDYERQYDSEDDRYYSSAPWGQLNIKSVKLYGVTTIGDDAFRLCDNLTSVTIDDSVTSIEGGAFHDCTGLTSITIPDSVTKIESYAFTNCDSLTSVTIPDGVTRIGPCSFNSCDNLTSITIGNSVTSIGSNAFAFCYSLAEITIPNSVTSIGNWTFNFCDSLTDVYYAGTQKQWNAIEIGEGNEDLTNATIHFNS